MRPDVGAAIWGGAMISPVKNYNAANWLIIAKSVGLKTGAKPVPGAIAVYQPFVQGAASTGHVAHVTAVDPDGTHFTVDEVNFPIPGLLDSRDSSVEPGVSFIY